MQAFLIYCFWKLCKNFLRKISFSLFLCSVCTITRIISTVERWVLIILWRICEALILCNVINLKQTIFILKKLDVFCFFLYAYIVKKNHEPAAEKDVMLMKHSQKRTFMDIEKMSSNEFKAFCRQTAQTLIFLPLLKRWNCMVLQAEKIQNPRLK